MVIGAAVELSNFPERIDEVFTVLASCGLTGQAGAAGLPRGAKLPMHGCDHHQNVAAPAMKAPCMAHTSSTQAPPRSWCPAAGGMTNAPESAWRKARAVLSLRQDPRSSITDDGTARRRLLCRRSMGDFAKPTPIAYQFNPRPIKGDAYAMETLTRARKAVERAGFTRKSSPRHRHGEAGPLTIGNMKFHSAKIRSLKIPGLKPAFRSNVNHHAAASLRKRRCAGGAVLPNVFARRRDGLPTLADQVHHSDPPPGTAVVYTIAGSRDPKLLDKVGWSDRYATFFEINEALLLWRWRRSVTSEFPRDRLNGPWRAPARSATPSAHRRRVYCVTLLHALEAQNRKRVVVGKRNTLHRARSKPRAIAIERVFT